MVVDSGPSYYTSMAFSSSPSVSLRAFLQSIMPAPVLSRRLLTTEAEMPDDEQRSNISCKIGSDLVRKNILALFFNALSAQRNNPKQPV